MAVSSRLEIGPNPAGDKGKSLSKISEIVPVVGNPEPVNPIRGARSVHHPGGYNIDIVSGPAYQAQRETLMEIAARIHREVFYWHIPGARGLQMSREVVDKKMRMEDYEASIMLIRPEAVPGSDYIGYALQGVLPIHIPGGDIPFLYVSTRAIKEGHRGKHLGRFVLELAASAVHKEAIWAGHRTQSPPAVRSMEQSEIFRSGRFFPRERYYDRDTLAQDIMVNLFSQVRRHGKGVDWRTGVSKADYRIPNMAFVPDPTHGPTKLIQKWMERTLGMDFKNGDSLYEIGELK